MLLLSLWFVIMDFVIIVCGKGKELFVVDVGGGGGGKVILILLLVGFGLTKILWETLVLIGGFVMA